MLYNGIFQHVKSCVRLRYLTQTHKNILGLFHLDESTNAVKLLQVLQKGRLLSGEGYFRDSTVC